MAMADACDRPLVPKVVVPPTAKIVVKTLKAIIWSRYFCIRMALKSFDSLLRKLVGQVKLPNQGRLDVRELR